MSTATKIYIGVDFVATYGDDPQQMQNAITSDYVNDATVTCTIKDLAGNEVAPTGFSWPVTLSYVSGSNGKYQGTIDKSIAISAGVSYWLEITAVSGTLNDSRRIPLIAAYRELT